MEIIAPVVTMCQDGRWLAVTPDDAKISIGVIGRDEAEAKENFRFAVARRLKILARNERAKAQ